MRDEIIRLSGLFGQAVADLGEAKQAHEKRVSKLLKNLKDVADDAQDQKDKVDRLNTLLHRAHLALDTIHDTLCDTTKTSTRKSHNLEGYINRPDFVKLLEDIRDAKA